MKFLDIVDFFKTITSKETVDTNDIVLIRTSDGGLSSFPCRFLLPTYNRISNFNTATKYGRYLVADNATYCPTTANSSDVLLFFPNVFSMDTAQNGVQLYITALGDIYTRSFRGGNFRAWKKYIYEDTSSTNSAEDAYITLKDISDILTEEQKVKLTEKINSRIIDKQIADINAIADINTID